MPGNNLQARRRPVGSGSAGGARDANYTVPRMAPASVHGDDRDVNQRERGMPPTLVCALGREDNSACVDVAARLCRTLGLRLVLAHVAEGIEASGEEGSESLTTAQARKGASGLLSRVAAEHGVAGSAALRADVGDPAKRLARIADEEGAAVVVVGSRRAGIFRSALKAGVAEELAVLAPCPVVVAPPQPAATGQRRGSAATA
jgi:nucleotide-binding universal stress UspA family protein